MREGSVRQAYFIFRTSPALKAALQARGHRFASETDTEIVAHLVADELGAGATGLAAAVRAALQRVHGTYAIAVVSEKSPGEIVAAKNASPLVIGFGKGESFLASDVPAILEHTREVVYLEEGELALLTADGVRVEGPDGRTRVRAPLHIEWSAVAAEKEGHKHFMHKEIHEQPRAVTDTIRGRTSLERGDVVLDGLDLDEGYVRSLERVSIVACGTSWHPGLSGRLMIESLARLPVEVELASEFRYREPLVGPRTLCLAISQSGETADTLAAVKEAKRRGARDPGGAAGDFGLRKSMAVVLAGRPPVEGRDHAPLDGGAGPFGFSGGQAADYRREGYPPR